MKMREVCPSPLDYSYRRRGDELAFVDVSLLVVGGYL